MRANLRFWLGAALLLACALLLRWPSFPREIWNLDEANTCVFGQQIQQGDLLYRDVVDTRGPLVAYLLAGELRLVGDWNMAGLHALQALMLGLTAVLLWRTLARLGNARAGAWAAAAFTLVSVIYIDPIDAFTTHTEWFVVFFSALGFWLLVQAWMRMRAALALLAGVSFGLSYLAKQPGLLDGFTAVVWMTLLLSFNPDARRKRLQLLGAVVVGFVAIAAGAPCYFWLRGAFHEYQFYVWTYSTRYYLPEVPAMHQWKALRMPFVFAWEHLPFFGLAAAVAVLFLLQGLFRSLRRRLAGEEISLLALGWTTAGVLASGLGGREFDHYSIQAIPGLSLLAGWTLASAWRQSHETQSRGLTLLWRGLAILPFVAGSIQACRRLSSLELGPDLSKTVGEAIRANTAPSERIFVWGFYPEINFFAHRLNASRFPSANFLTGLIPWTNLAPDKDTSYAVVPGAWDEFWQDMERHPPAIFVDTGTNRGYSKYPLRRQARLWAYLQAHYVEIEADIARPRGFRLYRRTGAALAASSVPALDPTLALKEEFQGLPHPDTLHVYPQLGVVAAELMVNGHTTGAVPFDPAIRHQLTFTYSPSFQGRNPVVAVRAKLRDGSIVSGPTFAIDETRMLRQPVINCGSAELAPLVSECLVGPLVWLPDKKVFSAHAPARLVFDRPKALESIAFDFGIFDGAFAPSQKTPTDGVELQVSFKPNDGPPQRLLTKALDPRLVAADRGPHRVEVELPKEKSGQLIIVISSGPKSDANSDWAYLGPITGQAVPLTLAQNGRSFLPAEVDAPLGIAEVLVDSHLMVLAHAPSAVEFDLLPNARTISGDFAMKETSWQNPAGQTAGIDFIAETVGAEGRVTELWRHRLEPAQRSADRGVYSFIFALPPGASGRLRFRATPAHPPNNAYGYSCWANLQVRDEP